LKQNKQEYLLPPADEILGQQKLQDLLISMGNAIQVPRPSPKSCFCLTHFSSSATTRFWRATMAMEAAEEEGEGAVAGVGAPGTSTIDWRAPIVL